MVETADPPTVIGRCGLGEVSERVQALCIFGAPDYIDSFTLRASTALERSAEEWARLVLEEAALSRHSARRMWMLMGLQLGPAPHSPDYVQGWVIAARGHGWIRLETRSWYMAAQAICLVEYEEVTVSLSLRYENRPVARLVWAFVEGPHRRAVPIMLRQATELASGQATELNSPPRDGI